MKTPVEILKGAKVVLAERGLYKRPPNEQTSGLCSGEHASLTGNVDVYAACFVAAGCSVVRGAGEVPAGKVKVDPFRIRSRMAREPVWEVILPHLLKASPNGHTPSSFNDHPSTTIEDVQALLDRAIVLAETEAAK